MWLFCLTCADFLCSFSAEKSLKGRGFTVRVPFDCLFAEKSWKFARARMRARVLCVVDVRPYARVKCCGRIVSFSGADYGNYCQTWRARDGH